MRRSLERDLFASVLKEYEVSWGGFVPESDKVYYVGIGCELAEIKYFWHSKFFRPAAERRRYECFHGRAATRVPAGPKDLIIYEGDVLVVGP